MNWTYTRFETLQGNDFQRFDSEPLDPDAVVDRKIVEWTHNSGTYGTGGYGFVGFRFEGDAAEWLIIAVHGAVGWLKLDGEKLKDPSNDVRMQDTDEAYRSKFVGDEFTSVVVERHSMTATLRSGRTLALDENDGPVPRPGEARLRLSDDDDLTKSVFIAPTQTLYVRRG